MKKLAQLFYDLELPTFCFGRIFEYKFDRVPTQQEESEFFSEYYTIQVDEDDSYSY